MRVEQMGKQKRGKATIEGNNFDPAVSAVLYFMFHTGQLKAYPLDSSIYPDNENTRKLMTIEMLKMKLRCECQRVPSFRNRILTK